MNRGTFGFLMNEWRLDRLYERIAGAKHIRVAPLAMEATDIHGETWTHPAINEVSLLRETRQTAKIEICVNGRVVMPELVCDGVLVATPGGLDRLQSLRARPDPAAGGEDAGADLDQPVPPAPLVGRDPARRCRGPVPGAGGRQAAGGGGRRPVRGARGLHGRRARSTASAR